MTSTQHIEIVTIYNVAQRPAAKHASRFLAVVSLAVAVGWLWTVHQRVDPWLQEKLLIAGIGEMGAFMQLQPADGAKLTADDRKELKEAIQKLVAESTRRAAVLAGSRLVWVRLAYLAGGWLAIGAFAGIAGRNVVFMKRKGGLPLIILAGCAVGVTLWYALKQVAGGGEHYWIEGAFIAWLAVAGLIGVAFWGGLQMQRQSAVLMLLSTVASAVGIWCATEYGGMPTVPVAFYGKIVAVQSSYAWVLLLAVRILR